MGVSGRITTSALNTIVANANCCMANYYNSARVSRAEGLPCWSSEEAKGKKIGNILWIIGSWNQNAQGYPDADNWIDQAQLNAMISQLKGECGCGDVTIPSDTFTGTIVDVLDFAADNGDYIAVT